MNRAAYCQYCGKMIAFEKTKKGKQMPVDTPSVWYKPDSNGKDTILNDNGEIVKGWILKEKAAGLSVGYRPHFISCKEYKKDSSKQIDPKKQTNIIILNGAGQSGHNEENRYLLSFD